MNLPVICNIVFFLGILLLCLMNTVVMSSPLSQSAQQTQSNVTSFSPLLMSERNSATFEVALSQSSNSSSINMLEDQNEMEEERAWNEAVFAKYEHLSLNCTEHIPHEWREWMTKHPPSKAFNVCTSSSTFSVKYCCSYFALMLQFCSLLFIKTLKLFLYCTDCKIFSMHRMRFWCRSSICLGVCRRISQALNHLRSASL